MFLSLIRRALRRLPHRIAAPHAHHPLLDDSARRLIRAPEAPRRPGPAADIPLHGRDPPF